MYVILSQEREVGKGGDGNSRVSRVEITGFGSAVSVCKNYISQWNLVSNQWNGGKVMEDGIKLATVSIDGKVRKETSHT